LFWTYIKAWSPTLANVTGKPVAKRVIPESASAMIVMMAMTALCSAGIAEMGFAASAMTR
jgi:sugar (pentulose or hexulose) kinase